MTKNTEQKLIDDAISLLIVKLDAVDGALRSAYRETRLNNMPNASSYVQEAITFLISKQGAPVPVDEELKLIPFDWDKYLAGWEAYTRDEQPATQGHKFEIDNVYCLGFVVSDQICTFNLEGRFMGYKESEFDLFLKAKAETVTYWTNKYKDFCMGRYDSKEKAEHNARSNCLGQKFISYEVEDD